MERIRNPLIIITGIVAAVGALGFSVARAGMANPIGDGIRNERARLQTEAAQGEMVKAGATEEEAREKVRECRGKGGIRLRMLLDRRWDIGPMEMGRGCM